jgi:hypothetical protein
MLPNPALASCFRTSFPIPRPGLQSRFRIPSASKPCYIHPRSMSSLPQAKSEPFPNRTILHGHSGRAYSIQEILAQRHGQSLCVYRARCVPPTIRHNINTEANCSCKVTDEKVLLSKTWSGGIRLLVRATETSSFASQSADRGRHRSRLRTARLSISSWRPPSDQPEVFIQGYQEKYPPKCSHWTSGASWETNHSYWWVTRKVRHGVKSNLTI